MKTTNLIPTPRREAKRRRGQRNACAAACGAYALLLAASLGVAHLVGPGGSESVEARLAAVEQDTTRLERETAAARAELSAARSTLEANRTVAEQPDWSILMGLLARLTGEDVVLRSISVAPSVASQNVAPGKAPAVPAETVLEVAGVGRSPLSVSRHVLKLEGTGLFAKVVLLEHNREPYLNNNAIVFRVQCTFGDPATAHRLPQWQQPPQLHKALPEPQPSLSSVDPGGATR